jgi:antitoxin PrlF
MATATISAKGQVTLPAEVRKRLKLKPGDRLDFVFDAKGALLVQTKRKAIRAFTRDD